MKKNLFLSMLAVAGMLFATSCTQDEFNEPATGDYVEAKFTLNTLEGIATRAIGDGTQADVVTCAVFNANGDEIKDLRQTVRISGKTATYETRLVRGQAYRVAFFAYNEDADAYDVEDMKNIKVKGNQLSNVEVRDAFTAKVDVAASTFPINKVVTLYRPFAQLNLGATAEDIAAAKKAEITVIKSQVKVSNVYTAFNAYEDVVAGEPTDVTFAMNVIPTEGLSVDLNGDATIGEDEKFAYLSMNYILVGDAGNEKSLTDIEFVWEDANGTQNNPATTFNNIPVQRNYRTNVVGYLLTNPATFNIVIDEQFKTPAHNVDTPWDGNSEKEPEKDAEGAYLVKTAAELVWLANRPTTDINGDPYLRNIKLLSSIDLNGKEMNAITFRGTFDGQGNSISNVVFVSYDGANNAGASLFGERTFGTIKNLTINNAKATVNANGEGYVGAVLAGITDMGEVTLDNVHVYNSDLKGVMGVGGLVGSLNAGNVKLTINNCSVNDTKLGNILVDNKKENGHVAGLVGRVTGTLTINGNVSLNNVDITGYYSAERKEGSIDAVAATNLKSNLGTINVTTPVAVKNATVSKIPTTSAAGDATIASARGMFAFANSVNVGGNNYSGKTAILIADIDLEDQDWEPIGQTGATQFNGTFDGENYTISNLSIASMDHSDETHYASGLFGWTEVGTLKNITIKGANVKGGHLCAAVIGYVSGSVKLENCTVYNAEIICEEQSADDTDPEGDKAACIVGQVGGGPKVEGYIIVSNCSAYNSIVRAGRDAGQIVGAATSGNDKYVDVTSCSATNVTVEWNNTSTGKNINNDIIGRK